MKYTPQFTELSNSGVVVRVDISANSRMVKDAADTCWKPKGPMARSVSVKDSVVHDAVYKCSCIFSGMYCLYSAVFPQVLAHVT